MEMYSNNRGFSSGLQESVPDNNNDNYLWEPASDTADVISKSKFIMLIVTTPGSNSSLLCQCQN